MKRLLYVYNSKTTWTTNDLDTLRQNYSVSEAFLNSRALALKFTNPFKLAKYDKVFCWFGSLTFLPTIMMSKLLGKEVTVIAGGFDVAKVPSINYGGFCRSHTYMCLRRLLFKLADKVITVSEYNTSEAVKNAKIPKSKLKMIYHGFEVTPTSLPTFQERKNQIITIGALNPETLKRKGHDRFFKLAQELPQFNFVLVGKYSRETKEQVEKLNIQNLKLAGFVEDEELNSLMKESKYYVQLSEHEAFGCSVVEAGLHGCQLIVSDRSALPEVVGEHGEVFPPDDISKIKEFITKDKDSKRETVPQSIAFQNRFQSSRRQIALLEFVK